MASVSLTQSSGLGTPLKTQDGPYQIELEDIESDENTTTNTNSTNNLTAPHHTTKPSTSPMKPAADTHFITGFTGAGTASAEAAPPSLKSTYLVRACVCALAILLLWITSLNLSKVLVSSVISSPSLDLVLQSWNTLSAASLDQQNRTNICAHRQLTSCNNTLNTAVTAMLSQLATAQAENNVALIDAALVAQQCSSITVELINSLNKWSTSGVNHLVYNGTICSQEEIAQIQSMVQSSNVVDNKAYVIANVYSQGVDARSDRMLAYATNFTAYNKWYLQMKTNQSFFIFGNLSIIVPKFTDILGNITAGLSGPGDRLVDCMSFADGAELRCPDGAKAAWTTGSAPVKSAYDTIYSRLQNTYNLYHSVTGNMLGILNAVSAFYNTVLKPAQTGLASLGISLGGFPSTSFAIPSPPSVPSSIPDFPLNPGIYDVNFTRHYQEWQTAVDRAAQKTRAAAGTWWANQSAIASPLTPNYFSDYNPPDYQGSTSNENAQQKQESSNFRVQTAFALNQGSQIEFTDVNVTNSINQAGGFLSDQAKAISATNFNFAPLGGNLLIAPLVHIIPNLYLFALIIDYIWRGYRSVRLIIKYWFKSAVGLPVVDVRSYESNEGVSGPVKVVSILTNPCTVVAIIGFILLLALLSIIPPYTSIYNAYVEGCVTDKSGTVLTNNTFSIAFNFAQAEPQKVITEGFQSYDVQRNAYCGQHLQATADEYNSDLTSLSASRASQLDSRTRVLLFQKCLNFSVFETPSAYNWTYNRRHPLLIIQSALDPNVAPTQTVTFPGPCLQATIEPYQLKPAIFNCSIMPACLLTCSVTAQAISTPATVAGCNTEYMIHSFIARFWITILVFICLNLSRVLFMAAIVRLGWRSLTPKGFEFLSNCTRVGETSSTINAELVKELNKAIANFERFSIFLFGFAILMHIPYIAVLASVNQTIAYH